MSELVFGFCIITVPLIIGAMGLTYVIIGEVKKNNKE